MPGAQGRYVDDAVDVVGHDCCHGAGERAAERVADEGGALVPAESANEPERLAEVDFNILGRALSM